MDHAHTHHDGHGMQRQAAAPESSLNALAWSATLHCLTGCAIGEVLGMVIGTALGWGNLETIALAVVLAFLFGYSGWNKLSRWENTLKLFRDIYKVPLLPPEAAALLATSVEVTVPFLFLLGLGGRFQVPARGEDAVAGGGDDAHAQLGIVAKPDEGVAQLDRGLPVDGVDLRPI